MTNLLEILRFDLAEQAQRRTNYVFFAVLFGLALLVGGFFGSRLQLLMNNPVPLFANAPALVVGATRWLALFGMLALAGSVFARAAQKDWDYDFAGLLQSTGLREWQFVLGRLLASWLTALAILAAIPLGLLCALALPSNLPEHVGPMGLRAYLQGYALHAVPSVLVAGTLIFAAALLLRRALWVYLVSFVLLLAPGLLVAPLDWVGLAQLGELLQPINASDLKLTTTWVPVERNLQPVPVQAELLWNRLIWLAIAAAAAALLARQFRFSRVPPGPAGSLGKRRVRARPPERPVDRPVDRPAEPEEGRVAGRLAETTAAPTAAKPRHDLPARLRQLGARTLQQFRWLAGSYWLWIALAFGIAWSVSAGLQGGELTYSAALYPTTANLLARPMFVTMVLLVLALMAGEALWRERACRIDSLLDVTPAPNWVFSGGLLAAIVAILALTMGLFLVIAVVMQATRGVGEVAIAPLLVDLFSIRLVHAAILMVPVLLIHVLANNKSVGHLLTLLYFIALVLFPQVLERTLGVPKLALYGAMPEVRYSDMNGFGDLGPLRWFQLYWGLVALVLLVLVQRLWVRGADTGAPARLRLAMRGARGPARPAFAALVALALVTGGWIYYATEVLHRSPTQLRAAEFGDTDDRVTMRPAIADYARAYGHLEERHPDLAHVQVDLDVQPAAGILDARGAYLFENRGTQPLAEILLADTAVHALAGFEVDGQPFTPELTRVAGARMLHFRLPSPLAPGARVQIAFEYRSMPPAGFSADGAEQGWAANGLYLLSTSWLPRVGYLGYLENAARDTPRSGTPEDPRAADGDARHGHAATGAIDAVSVSDGASGERDPRRYAAGTWQQRATFEGQICTDPDQTGLLPGVLERTWEQAGRRCFAYRSDAPQHLQFHAISGRYAVERRRHGEVDLEVYYHPDHAFNVDTLLKAMGTALDLAAASYGPYPLAYLRIAEVPYLNAAISTPGTAVLGEPFGMTARVDRSRRGVLDLPFFVAAHEVAHQWWGEQVVPARAPGYAVILETLTQYGAVRAIEQEYGPESVRAFLGQELRDYLEARAQGSDVPLAEARTEQHVFYHKGAVVMYALRDALGADTFDAALADFFARYRQGPPFPLASDLMEALRAAAPPEQQPLITDLLETITLWSLKAERATSVRRPDGTHEVTLEIQASKARSDNAGSQTPIEMGTEMLDIGVLDARGEFLYLDKHPIGPGSNRVSVVVQQTPAQAGIDPQHLRIDREPDDNLVSVTPADDS
ncbi:MAG: hypothetical protein K9M02_06440 [Thiohalocapsa sp.]|nr:hypothetical protein [Thiohalocapsa sp.]